MPNSNTIIWTKEQALTAVGDLNNFLDEVKAEELRSISDALELLLADHAPLGGMNSLIIIIDHEDR